MMRIGFERIKDSSTKCLWSGKKIRKGTRVIQIGDEFLHPRNKRKMVKNIMELIDTERIPEPVFLKHPQDGRRMRILGLCCGRKGWESAFIERDHDVLTIDIDPEMEPDICMDIMDLTIEDIGTDWDIILVSPPCQTFSIGSCRWYWTADEPRVPNYERKGQAADDALQLVHHIYELIEQIKPKFWAMENPTAMLKKVWKAPAVSTFFASWSGGHLEYRRPKKATDLWGVFPESMPWPEPRHWEEAERGTLKGTQGMPFEDRGIIPWGLSFTFCIHAEAEILQQKKRSTPSSPSPEEKPKGKIRGVLELLMKLAPLMKEKPVVSLMRP
tara:strand:+ start:2434 stop:3417 length:984 start_codon:yes stop_codon:yes gene_type:complete